MSFMVMEKNIPNLLENGLEEKCNMHEKIIRKWQHEWSKIKHDEYGEILVLLLILLLLLELFYKFEIISQQNVVFSGK